MDTPTILGVLGSPRRRGNSHLLLRSFLDGAEAGGAQTKEVFLEKMNFSPCQACGACSKTGRCRIEDEMQSVYEHIEHAGGVVFAAPVHFGGIAARTKMAIDRFQCFWAAKYVLGNPRITLSDHKLGFFLCVGGMKNPRFCENALEVMNVFFTVTNIRPIGHLFFREVDQAGAVQSHPTALKDAYQAGEDMANRLKSR